VVAAVVVGALTGVTAASFRILLDHATALRYRLAHWSHGQWWGLIVVVLVCSTVTCIAAALVHRVEPHTEGSGIPRVEAVVEGRAEPGRFRILPVKYIGGLLSIGAGLALGREGPSVQMGGNVAVIIAKVSRRGRGDLRVLVAGGAAAGLATAFSAPIAGGVFVLEELVKRFDPRITIATLVASGSGFAASQLLIAPHTEFHVAPLRNPQLSGAPWVAGVGVLTGLLGVAYNKAVMFGLHRSDAARWPVEGRAACIGALVGALVWAAPNLAGSGDNLTQRALLGQGAFYAVVATLALRFVLGVVSYSAGTPGGLFAPMLTLGSYTGLLVGLIAHDIAPHSAPESAGLALIGMAAFLTASVRAPITGLILATEMTGTVNLLPPMLGACAIAMIVATVLRSEPIYDQLTERSAAAARQNIAEAN
jgi:CIC family chloride channel protein